MHEVSKSFASIHSSILKFQDLFAFVARVDVYSSIVFAVQ